jgi:hypothetical protein
VSNFVRSELPMPLQDRGLNLSEQLCRSPRPFGSMPVGLDQTNSNQCVLPPTQRPQPHVALDNLTCTRVGDRGAD